tara:strand:- start:5102 stop:5380 length:279 start_codon:yes stop_codon:yes gene_type:complete
MINRSMFTGMIRMTFVVILLVPLAGCDPLVNIEGAFFPAWLISGIAGIICMVVSWSMLRRFGIDQHLPLRSLSYISMLILYTTLIWLVFYAK